MKEQIVNLDNKRVQAAAQFLYKGFLISFSTIFKTNSVAIFNVTNETVVKENLNTVEEAINWINKIN